MTYSVTLNKKRKWKIKTIWEVMRENMRAPHNIYPKAPMITAILFLPNVGNKS